MPVRKRRLFTEHTVKARAGWQGVIIGQCHGDCIGGKCIRGKRNPIHQIRGTLDHVIDIGDAAGQEDFKTAVGIKAAGLKLGRRGEGIGHDRLAPGGGDQVVCARGQRSQIGNRVYHCDELGAKCAIGLGQIEIIPERVAVADQGPDPNHILALESQQGPRVINTGGIIGRDDTDRPEPRYIAGGHTLCMDLGRTRNGHA